MPRKRKIRVVHEIEDNAVLNIQDAEGFYPYRLKYEVKDRRNNITRVFLGAVPNHHKDNANRTIGSRKKTFHHQHIAKHPDLCREFAIVSATHAINSRHSVSQIQTDLSAISMFFQFLESNDKKVSSFHDFCTDLMAEYRSYIREQPFSEDSSYKGAHYHPIKTMLSITMGTRRGPDPFEIPIYQVDLNTRRHLQTYSDMVMYQIIAAAYYDCVAIMDAVEEFEGYVRRGTPQTRVYGSKIKERSWNLENFAWFYVNILELNRPPYSQAFAEKTKVRNHGSMVKTHLGLSTIALIKSKTDDEWKKLALKGHDPRGQHQRITQASKADLAATWRSEASFLTNGFDKLKNARTLKHYQTYKFFSRDDLLVFLKPPFSDHIGHAFLQRELPTKNTLLPFFILFSIYTGRNSEVMHTWKRTTSEGKCILSLEYNADPLNTDAVLIEGWKYRGKRHKKEKDDVSVEVDSLLYSLLEFVIKYTKPLADYQGSNDIWLYMAIDGTYSVCSYRNKHRRALKDFCNRHKIYDESGEQLESIDARLFRKVFITHELLTHINQHTSFEDLATDLQKKMGHKSFDTTFSNYLNNDTSTASIDSAIVALQRQLLIEAKAQCALMDSATAEDERIGLPTLQARCTPPNASETNRTAHNCEDYDYCLGCKRSRVYEEHIPRICARLLQYESKKSEMDEQQWLLEFHDKHTRAHDVLERWSKKAQVERAWEQARNGKIKMPVLSY
ncbi:hypothetical protein BS057_RS10705 [Vibrio parahaemolyticus]|nr:hypothetical protein [Vibrio parahaemolyticus]